MHAHVTSHKLQAVKEFRAESAFFKSPAAEEKWGRIADWDVSQVTGMCGLFFEMKEFNQDLSLWDVGKVGDMGVRRAQPCRLQQPS